MLGVAAGRLVNAVMQAFKLSSDVAHTGVLRLTQASAVQAVEVQPVKCMPMGIRARQGYASANTIPPRPANASHGQASGKGRTDHLGWQAAL